MDGRLLRGVLVRQSVLDPKIEIPEHETTRGVKPFEVKDEWYYHMRFVTT